mmetsp:Transcript_66701/g.217094  ORF Transcript_66701/g.217094 Transcript_66701/m.217094 type:complete len:129 (-) Transcript_66701:1779-2165(-)
MPRFCRTVRTQPATATNKAKARPVIAQGGAPEPALVATDPSPEDELAEWTAAEVAEGAATEAAEELPTVTPALAAGIIEAPKEVAEGARVAERAAEGAATDPFPDNPPESPLKLSPLSTSISAGIIEA